MLIIAVQEKRLESKEKPNYKQLYNQCATDYNNLLKLEQGCFEDYTNAKLAIEKNVKLNDSLMREINNQKRLNRKGKIKVGVIAGTITLCVGFSIGLGLGIYLIRKGK